MAQKTKDNSDKHREDVLEHGKLYREQSRHKVLEQQNTYRENKKDKYSTQAHDIMTITQKVH